MAFQSNPDLPHIPHNATPLLIVFKSLWGRNSKYPSADSTPTLGGLTPFHSYPTSFQKVSILLLFSNIKELRASFLKAGGPTHLHSLAPLYAAVLWFSLLLTQFRVTQPKILGAALLSGVWRDPDLFGKFHASSIKKSQPLINSSTYR